MERIKLGNSKVEVSRLGLGAWQASGKPWGEDVKEEDCIEAVVRANELGINLVDTAEGYGQGRSEEVVGKAIKRLNRDDILVATKVTGSHLRYDQVIKACELSIKRLGVESIDLYQIHWPSVWDQVPLKETMKALEKLYKEGKVRSIGVSNFAVRDMEEARSALSFTDIVSNQVQYNMVHREIEKEVLPYCQREGITVLAWGPLAEGALSGKYSESNPPRDSVRVSHPYFWPQNIEAINKVVNISEEIGRTKGKTPVQVALNWLLAKKGVVPIPGAKTPKQAEENAGAYGWSLTGKEMELIGKTLESILIEFV